MKNDKFLEAANKHKDMIFRVALGYFGSKFDADDAVQDVLLKLYTCEKVFDSEEHIKHWLIRVTINVCKNTLRAPWRRNHLNLDELTATIDFQYKEQSELFLLVMKMKEKYRTVLNLHYFEEYSVAQIAGILGIKESAVTTRLYRARKILKDTLKNGGISGEQ